MAETLTAARPYAKALYDVARQKDASHWLPVMKLCQALGDDEGSRRFLKAGDLTEQKFLDFIATLAEKSGIETVPKKFVNFIALVDKNKRFALLPEIASLFIDEVNKSNDTVIAEIVSAQPLTAESEQNLIAKLESKYGKKVQASITIDNSLIGGAVIKVGDTVVDGSVKGRLEQLTKALN